MLKNPSIKVSKYVGGVMTKPIKVKLACHSKSRPNEVILYYMCFFSLLLRLKSKLDQYISMR